MRIETAIATAVVAAMTAAIAAAQDEPSDCIRVEAPDFGSHFLLYPAEGEGPRPLIVALHGMGDAVESFAASWAGMPAGKGYVLAVPCGNKEVPCMCGRCSGKVKTWGADSDRFVLWVAEEAARRTKIDPARVYIYGFSAGGHMTFWTALMNPARFAAAIPCAGMLPPQVGQEQLEKARSLPVFGYVGEMDPARTAMSAAFKRLEKAGFRRAELEEVPDIGHEVPCSEHAALLRELDRMAAVRAEKEPGLIKSLEEGRKAWTAGECAAAVRALLAVSSSGVHGPFAVEANELLQKAEKLGLERIEGAKAKAAAGDPKAAARILESVRADFAGLECVAKADMKPCRPGDHEFKLSSGGRDRTYSVHVPTGYDGFDRVPVVMMLHGGGGTGKGAAEETGWSAKADKERFLAVYPDALPKDPSRPGRFSTNPQTWNDGSGRFGDEERKADDTGFLAAVIDAVIERFAADPDRVFVTGFSNGASMTFRAGAELADRVAAIAPFAGACWIEEPKPGRGVPLLYVTGDSDPLNPLEGGMPKTAKAGLPLGGREKPPVAESIRRWTAAIGCRANPAGDTDKDGLRTVSYLPGRDGADAVFVVVRGLGHAWAGGKSLLPESVAGKMLSSPDLTAMIWDFFRNRSRK